MSMGMEPPPRGGAGELINVCKDLWARWREVPRSAERDCEGIMCPDPIPGARM